MVVPIVIPVPVPVRIASPHGPDDGVKRSILSAWWLISLAVTTVLLGSMLLGRSPSSNDGATAGTSHVPASPQVLQEREEKAKAVDDDEYCRSTVPIFINSGQARKRRGTPRPRLSIVFITKRPGGYDILLHSLASQMHTDDYELVVVDELVPHRGHSINAMAAELGVNLVATVPSKAKDVPHAHLRFGIYNALNTGLLLARGDIIAFVMDMTWLPDNFVSRTLEFYDDPKHARSLLAYPEWFMHLRKESPQYPSSDHVWDEKSLLTTFPKNFTRAFIKDFQWFHTGQMRPEALVKDHLCSDHKDICDQLNLNPNADASVGRHRTFETQPVAEEGDYKFWELSTATAPWNVIEEMNGLEEEFDYGDDCHESNIRMRAEMLGSDLWIDVQTVVQNLWHKNTFQPGTGLWDRFAEDNIMYDVLSKYPADIREGRRPLASRNSFNLTIWRELDCAAKLV